MDPEPRLALAASPREWAGRLHRHVADHGGAVVRATVLHPRDALAEDYDVFIADDCTSFLTRRLVHDLHSLGRTVVGVFDADDAVGKGELADLGVDQVIARDADPAEFLAVVRSLARPRLGAHAELDALVRGPAAHDAPSPPVQPERGPVVVVAGAAGGVGTSEVAIGLAASADRCGAPVILADVDGAAPSLAQRLGAPAYPNIRAALDAFEQDAELDAAMVACPGARLRLLPGLSNPRTWSELRPAETLELLRTLARPNRHVIADVGHGVEELHTLGGPGRHALARTLLGSADAVVGVSHPSPVGVTRLLAWLAEVRDLMAPGAPLHLVFNRAPSSGFKQGELVAEVTRTVTPASLWFLPADPRVEAASWAGTVQTRGPFAKAVHAMAAGILPGLAPRHRGGDARSLSWSHREQHTRRTRAR